MNRERPFSLVDQLCGGVDQLLRALTANPKTSGRTYPGTLRAEASLSPEETRHAAGLMRVNHAGEICAQALYHGQALVSREPATRAKLEQAAIEEGDHLAWCKRRLTELGSHPSYLNPLWYVGSLVMGMAAGMVGDRFSLGFVAETEKQVVQHLQKHLEQMPQQDEKSIQILQQMQQDEEQHQQAAELMGASVLPQPLQKAMSLVSKLMVKTAYWL